ncbi:hypothetical protein B2J86_09340 [Acidovorax sp. SRB_14]|uniref:glycerophosphodiester phosphodiesterase family protein n=1 Tax=Acidovorax sp. SRB_14 TaxID=1962699 RepID=UPI00146F54C7|nr:glycerophosphodiester phosphodiesterase family protein [Acidovorax sp. SRB_14]NMM81123.1 hypothetical protein [Acidovorax sp. SRB_14]NMM90280.1 hypothetical protein [Rhodococcus sp. SRB_17]
MFKPSLLAALCVCTLVTVGCSSLGTGPAGSAAKPQVIAHRGASGYLPEHTLAGYELAVRMGSDFIEPDLQLTRDGQLVAMHDDSLQRTTNVASVFAQRGGAYKVADFTLAEIKRLTVQPFGPTAGTAHAGFVPTAAQPLAVPTFQEVIDLARAQSAATGREVGIYPEAKQADPDMEDGILQALQANGYRAGSKLFIQSFSDATLRSLRAKQQAQGLAYPLVQLGYAAVAEDGGVRMRVRGPDGWRLLTLPEVATFSAGVGVSVGNKAYPVTQAFIDQAHAAGMRVHGWTFNKPDAALAAAEFQSYLAMGMDGMFANYPDLAVAARNAWAAQPKP